MHEGHKAIMEKRGKSIRWGGRGKNIKPKIEVIPGVTVESGETLQQINISEKILKRQHIILPALNECRNNAIPNLFCLSISPVWALAQMPSAANSTAGQPSLPKAKIQRNFPK